MKNTNFKTIWVFTLSILLFSLLVSCNKAVIDEASVIFDDTTSSSIEKAMDTEEEKIMNKAEWEDAEMMGKTEWEDLTKDEMEIMDKEDSMKKEDLMNKDDTMEKEKTMEDKVWVYADYLPELVSNAKWNIVLFFHANWCPACVSIEKNILSNKIPSDLTLLKVDYDNSTELKTKYGVLAQTTFVQVDSKWNMIKKWVSARNLADIVSKIQ